MLNVLALRAYKLALHYKYFHFFKNLISNLAMTLKDFWQDSILDLFSLLAKRNTLLVVQVRLVEKLQCIYSTTIFIKLYGEGVEISAGVYCR